MQHSIGSTCLVGTLTAFLAATASTRAEVTVLVPDIDNTLIEAEKGNLSLGASPFVFAGRVGGQTGTAIRRAVLRFPVDEEIPAGAMIEQVELRMELMMTSAGPEPVSVHRCLESWGEGTSNGPGGGGAPASRGDATWTHRFWPNVEWSVSGGTFEANTSAVIQVAGPAVYTWSSNEALVADVRYWLDHPDENHGWLLRGNEETAQTVKAFASRQHANLAARPTLVITWSLEQDLVGDLNGDGVIDGADLGLLLAQWGVCPESAEPCEGDLDGNGEVDGADLGVLLANWAPG